MSAGYQALSEKEKQTLRLIVRGHDAKSMARHLGLSVHTVNERLRDARRKLEVSSSREAARLLFDTEATHPQKLVDDRIGDDAAAATSEKAGQPGIGQGQPPRAPWIIGGAVIMSIFVGLLALAALADQAAPPATAAGPAPASISAPVAIAESDAVRAARAWLVLSDEGRWKDGWNATASSFRKLNTAAKWAEVATKVRPPLGAVLARTAISQEDVPAPPAGVEVVKFRTSFANKANALETVSLAREGGQWRVVGIYIE